MCRALSTLMAQLINRSLLLEHKETTLFNYIKLLTLENKEMIIK